MSNEQQSQTQKTPRTEIEDLVPAEGELAEVDASQVSGGMVVIRGAGTGLPTSRQTSTDRGDTDYTGD